jgi:hypothetical protein
MPKPSNADRERVRSLGPDKDDVETRPTVGNPRALVHRRTIMGRFCNGIGVKLVDSDPAKLAAMPGAGPLGPVERPTSGCVTVPTDPTTDKAKPWVAEAYKPAAPLPPKEPKTKATKK